MICFISYSRAVYLPSILIASNVYVQPPAIGLLHCRAFATGVHECIFGFVLHLDMLASCRNHLKDGHFNRGIISSTSGLYLLPFPICTSLAVPNPMKLSLTCYTFGTRTVRMSTSAYAPWAPTPSRPPVQSYPRLAHRASCTISRRASRARFGRGRILYLCSRPSGFVLLVVSSMFLGISVCANGVLTD
jgi:hypothetical protein